AGIEPVEVARRGEVLTGDSPEALVRALGERLRELGSRAAAEAPSLPAPRAGAAAPPVWVLAELDAHGPGPVTAELLAKAAELAARLGAPVEAVVIGADAPVEALAAAG